MTDVAGTGFTTLDRVYSGGVKVSEALGGSCGNVLISLAMLGWSVVPLLSLGCDAAGSSLVEEFRQAGADTGYIWRRAGVSSPILAQLLDVEAALHSFSKVCPQTGEALPRYQPVSNEDVEAAQSVLAECRVFYADRLSPSILLAMESAATGAAVIFFEPSRIGERELFDRALRLCTVLKWSSEQLPVELTDRIVDADTVAVVTHGARGLEIFAHGQQRCCACAPAMAVRDSCGAGDMLSVGIIDWLLGSSWSGTDRFEMDYFLAGVTAGQRLAAANCACVGARGVFRERGRDGVRRILDGSSG